MTVTKRQSWCRAAIVAGLILTLLAGLMPRSAAAEEDARQYETRCQGKLFCFVTIAWERSVELWVESFTEETFTLVVRAAVKNLTGEPTRRRLVLDKPGVQKLLSFTLPQAGDWALDWSYSFHIGTESARHDDQQVYALPYGPDEAYRVIQAANGSFSHQGSLRNAIDWAMLEGTEVRAARGGVVVGLREDSKRGAADPDFRGAENYLWIRHDDGTIGQYVHLQKDGVLVALGQRVKTGQVIARAGKTGYTSEPHLHFHVSTPSEGSYAFETFPLRFRLRNGQAASLREGLRYRAP